MSIQEANLKAIADAIREKEGSAEPIPAGDFAERIRAMRIGGDVTLASIAITAPPNQVSYKTGSLFDPTGMSVWAEFSNGYGLNVHHADLVFHPAGPLEEGTQSVTVRFTWNGETAEAEQAVSVKNFQIYGVEWDGAPGTKLSRTDAAAGFVDPVAAVGDGPGSSPFDDIMPWAGMVRVTQDGNELVAIPKYWVKVQHDPFRVQISEEPDEGFQVSPAHRDRGDGYGERDVVYIGRYECDNEFRSRSGEAPRYRTSPQTFRTGIHGLGPFYWQSDYALQLTWWYLYLVEFADWDSQTVIGYGGDDGVNGATDSMTYHTGRSIGVGVKNTVQYRNIEGLWCRFLEWRDGIIFSDANISTYNNPADFSSLYNGTGAVIRSNQRATSTGLIAEWGCDSADPSFIYPSKVGGSSGPFVPDNCSYSANVRACACGGVPVHGTNSGAFFIYGDSLPDGSSSSISSRIMKLPNPTEEEVT